MSKRVPYPNWRYPSLRAFKAQKRRDAKAAEKALHDLLVGCAFTPSRNVGLLLEQVQEIRKRFSVKEWGR